MTHDPVRALLLACLHQESNRPDEATIDALDEAGWDRVGALAAGQRVRPLLYQRLTQHDLKTRVPERVWQALERTSRQTAARNLRVDVELAALARTLAADDIPLIVLKGAYLTQAVYKNAALREMNDVDVLLRQEHLHRAVDVLRARGYQPLKSFSVDLDAAVHHHVTRLIKPGTAAIELHWNITMPHQAYSIDPADLWRRAAPVAIGGATMLGLSAEDLLLHLCFHTSYQHRFEFGLRPFCDIAATIRRFQTEIDWHEVQRRSRDWRWGRGVHLALHLAAELVGAAVPVEVLTALSSVDDDTDLFETAGAQVFADKVELNDVSEEFAKLRDGTNLWSKVGHLCRRIFLSQLEMKKRYSVGPYSPTFLLFYLVRLWDLMRFYGRMATRLLLKSEPELVKMAERKNRLRAWLIEP